MSAVQDVRLDMAEPTVIVRHLVTVEPSGCWRWLRYIAPAGYGRVGRNKQAHRWVYEQLVGPIPDGLPLDHLCRNRACVNPAHLEPVTTAVNNQRAAATITHCPRDHEYAPENTYVTRKGERQCRACRRDRMREYRKAAKL